MDYDVFISHASEDKADVARPLAVHLQKLGLRVWLDELELTLGDSLRRKIDQGLARSQFGLVILSPAFFSKEWPNKELDGLVAREDGREKVVLPVWHTVNASDIVKFSPILADRVAVSTARELASVAQQVVAAVRRASISEDGFRKSAVENETEVLTRLRKEMLMAPSPREIRRLQYELEAHMAKYPYSPEARLLKDTMEDARKPELILSAPMKKPKWLFVLGLVLLGSLIFALFMVIRIIIGKL
jgi:hypothetical protein